MVPLLKDSLMMNVSSKDLMSHPEVTESLSAHCTAVRCLHLKACQCGAAQASALQVIASCWLCCPSCVASGLICAPLTAPAGLHRKQLMEAWEVAEWEGRETQIRALQEAQLKEFEDTIKAKHAQVLTLPSQISCRVAQCPVHDRCSESRMPGNSI